MIKIKLHVVAGLSLLFACTSSQQNHPKIVSLVGSVTREQIENDHHQELSAVANSPLIPETIQALRKVSSGAEVDVYFGTWCSDSIRELSRLWLILDALAETVPFKIRYIGVDRQKHAPDLLANLGLDFVPTIVVSREGVEVGRIVESAPLGLEAELLSLLTGTKSGVISGRPGLSSLRR